LLAARCHNQRAPFDTPSLDERGSQRVEQAQESAQTAKDRAVDATVAAKDAAIGTGAAAWHGTVAGISDYDAINHERTEVRCERLRVRISDVKRCACHRARAHTFTNHIVGHSQAQTKQQQQLQQQALAQQLTRRRRLLALQLRRLRRQLQTPGTVLLLKENKSTKAPKTMQQQHCRPAKRSVLALLRWPKMALLLQWRRSRSCLVLWRTLLSAQLKQWKTLLSTLLQLPKTRLLLLRKLWKTQLLVLVTQLLTLLLSLLLTLLVGLKGHQCW
jgi:hypothetical protein